MSAPDADDRLASEGPVPAATAIQLEWAAAALDASPEWIYTDGPTGVAHRASDNTEWERRYGTKAKVNAGEGFTRLAEWMSAHR